jgi:hypothetical protein
MLYLIQISRFVVAFIFLYSFLTKLRDFAAFEHAIQNFQLLPKNLHRPAAFAFMFGEALIFLAALLGGNWLFLSHSLAIALLLLFICALNSVLQRKIQASCNCFGTSEQKVSPYDIWRNAGVVLVAALGFFALFWENSSPNLLDFALSALIALVFSLLLLNLRELMELLIQ